MDMPYELVCKVEGKDYTFIAYINVSNDFGKQGVVVALPEGCNVSVLIRIPVDKMCTLLKLQEQELIKLGVEVFLRNEWPSKLVSQMDQVEVNGSFFDSF